MTRRLTNLWSGRPLAVRGDTGDVPGWVLVTLMTAGLVIGLWAVAGDALNNVFTEAMNRVMAN